MYLLLYATTKDQPMKQMTGKWKYSKKKNAWVMKWKVRKVKKTVSILRECHEVS